MGWGRKVNDLTLEIGNKCNLVFIWCFHKLDEIGNIFIKGFTKRESQILRR